MIKNVKIHNVFGIKDFEIDFSVKNQRQDKGLEDQLKKCGDEYISLIPTFLAKNAAGKTSFIKALSLALDLANPEKFKRKIVFYKSREIEDAIKQVQSNLDDFNDVDTQPIFLDTDKRFIAKKMFQEVSFAGSKEASVEIELTKDRSIKIQLTNDSFEIVLNKTVINIVDLLNDVCKINLDDINHKTRRDTQIKIEENITQWMSKTNIFENFSDVNSNAIFRANTPIVNMHEIMIKNNTNRHIKIIGKEMGYQAIETLLLKLDKNIESISSNEEQKKIDIFLKGNDFPISASNLSFGTQKTLEIICYSIPLFKAGGVLMIDEIENGLHLSLIKLIVSLYSDESINLENAQLLLTTHNPLLAERDIVEVYNMYMQENDNFVNMNSIAGKERTENKIQALKTKNYYNDLFWSLKDKETKSTLSHIAINQIIESMSEGDKWVNQQQK